MVQLAGAALDVGAAADLVRRGVAVDKQNKEEDDKGEVKGHIEEHNEERRGVF